MRLHSTYRHDLKIYCSDEGRVQTSAAAFAKGLLDLEGASLTPILASLVSKDTAMLDALHKAAEDMQRVKEKLYEYVTWNKEERAAAFTPLSITSPLPSPPPSPEQTAMKGKMNEVLCKSP